MKYLIENMCIDATASTEIDLTDEELKVISRFVKENNKNAKDLSYPHIFIYFEYEVKNVKFEGKKMVKLEEE